MKRSLYQMLGVPPDANQAQIDSAYADLSAQLSAGVARGNSDAVNELVLLKDGYRILSNPERRAQYDAFLSNEGDIESTLVFLPKGIKDRSRLGIGTVVLAAVAAILGGVVYTELTREMDALRSEHELAVAARRAELNKPIKLVDPAIEAVIRTSNKTIEHQEPVR